MKSSGETFIKTAEILAASQSPFFIGVRHHSPVLSAFAGRMLDEFKPDCVLMEFPADLEDVIPLISHAQTIAPVALSARSKEAGHHSEVFYPFADFSPELQVMRWCRENDIPLKAADLPAGAVHNPENETSETIDAPNSPGVSESLMKHFEADDTHELWERMIEESGAGRTSEELRRSALLCGIIMRMTGESPDSETLVREAHMRKTLEEAISDGYKRIAFVCGSYHCVGISAQTLSLDFPRNTHAVSEIREMDSCLVPYSFSLLDSRSGYASGIDFPLWRQKVWENLYESPDGSTLDNAALELILKAARKMREMNMLITFPDIRETWRMALDLSALRSHKSVTIRDITDAIEASCIKGDARDIFARRGIESVFSEERQGHLCPQAPIPPLGKNVQTELEALGLPVKSATPAVFRLSPAESPKDLKRHILLCRLEILGIPYGERISERDTNITTVWRVAWTPFVHSALGFLAVYGQDSFSAARGYLKVMFRKACETPDEDIPLYAAAEGAFPDLFSEMATFIIENSRFPSDAASLQHMGILISRIKQGLLYQFEPDHDVLEALFDIIINKLISLHEGHINSPSIDSIRAISATVAMASNSMPRTLYWFLERCTSSPSQLISACGWCNLVMAGKTEGSVAGSILGSVFELGDISSARDFTKGVLASALNLFEMDETVSGPFHERIRTMNDDTFLSHLPWLRDAFSVLSSADRQRFVSILGVREDHLSGIFTDSGDAAILARCDKAGFEKVKELFPDIEFAQPVIKTDSTSPAVQDETYTVTVGKISLNARWQLILGIMPRDKNYAAHARALSAVFGAGGGGEGSHLDFGGAGSGDSYPTVREWEADIGGLFTSENRDFLVEKAVRENWAAAVTDLDIDALPPSVDLLESIMSLKGSLSEDRIARLRPLIKRIVDELTKRLRSRVSSALSGIKTPFSSRRKSGSIDLKRTVKGNLSKVIFDPNPVIMADHFYFRKRAARRMEYTVFLLVDVSGSMNRSVIFSAVTAAIIASLPAVEVKFLAFNTETVDLSGLVSDPLSLLLEVDIGGGTDIFRALKTAHSMMKSPPRSFLVLVSDFEENSSDYPMMREIAAMAEAGVKMTGIAALDDTGKAVYNTQTASKAAAAGMAVGVSSPLDLARWLAGYLK
ncbi:VWA domain-containing protein [Myxococcota bacterium]|nr:VWA domain-containing protein [Myxococcota bacterium]MBU1498296.1 VWA domain-containing protein [Myxococcota bacterium]